MSYRAKRIAKPTSVVSFPWDGGRRSQDEASAQAPAEAPAPDPQHLAAVEQEAYDKGLAQGEAAGLEAASQRGEATLKRLTHTLEELGTLRHEVVRHTERQMVDIALAVARRIVHREVALDRDLLVAMARVALERLGDGARVTVRLHPDEYEATGVGRNPQRLGTNVIVLADPRIEPGGCRLESDLGVIDAGVDAQIQEIARALFSEERRETHGNVVTLSARRRVEAEGRAASGASDSASDEQDVTAERKPA